MKPKTEEEFKQVFGYLPQDDDLDRINCDKAGKEVGHLMCGWCKEHQQARFMCGCFITWTAHSPQKQLDKRRSRYQTMETDMSEKKWVPRGEVVETLAPILIGICTGSILLILSFGFITWRWGPGATRALILCTVVSITTFLITYKRQ